MKLFKSIKNFYFQNMKLVNKFWLNQIALSIFGMMVTISLSAFGVIPMILASVFASFFFVSLLYDNAWDEGARDRNRVSNGRLKYRPFYGAKVALFAYIPTLFFAIPGVICSTLWLFDIHFIDSFIAVCKAIVVFFCNGTYLGLTYIANEASIDVSFYFSIVCLLPGIISYYLGYKLGLDDKQIKTVFGMKPSLGDGAIKPKKR